MPQGATGFQYKEDRGEDSMTGLAGLPVYLDLAAVMGLSKSIRRHVQVRAGNERAWSDVDQVMSIVLLNAAGGDCVDDLEKLQADKGLCRVLARLRADELEGLSRQQRRAVVRAWEKAGRRGVPSPTAAREYLKCFHDEGQEVERATSPVKAFIPKANQHLMGLGRVNGDIVSFVQSRSPQKNATLDVDATLVHTHKDQALHCYKGPKAYQPLNVWWAEQHMVLHTDFRDGNVPAGYDLLRVFGEALDTLPEGVETVWLRSDTAGYQHDIMRYCENATNERFGRIKFAIGCDVTFEFKKAVAEVPEGEWKRVRKYERQTDTYEETPLECAEVCFVPNGIGHSKSGLEYRYIATRELLSDQRKLPETGKLGEQQNLPFPTIELGQLGYKLHGLVTNIGPDENTAGQVVEWLHERCGHSEMAHSMMKTDFAGGQLPSGYFGANAAWWWMMMLALNLTQAMKQLALGASGSSRRMKALRFSLFSLPGRIVTHAGELIIRIAKGHPSLDWLLDIRERIAALGEPAPA
jgi:hypothetical protein